MSVIRVKKHLENYVILHKEILENAEISLKSKGLWAFCMAKPDDWEFHVEQLEKTLKEGEKALYSALEELIEFGYVKRVQGKGPKGRFQATDYEIFETSQLKKCLPHRPFGDADNGRADKAELLRNNYTKELKKPIPPPPSSTNTSSLDPTPEEEEEIRKRLRERPKNAQSVKNINKWSAKVLEEMRAEKIEKCTANEILEQEKNSKEREVKNHKAEAEFYDGKELNGWKVKACYDRVEFSKGRSCSPVGYDVPDADWYRAVPWKGGSKK